MPIHVSLDWPARGWGRRSSDGAKEGIGARELIAVKVPLALSRMSTLALVNATYTLKRPIVSFRFDEDDQLHDVDMIQILLGFLPQGVRFAQQVLRSPPLWTIQ